MFRGNTVFDVYDRCQRLIKINAAGTVCSNQCMLRQVGNARKHKYKKYSLKLKQIKYFFIE